MLGWLGAGRLAVILGLTANRLAQCETANGPDFSADAQSPALPSRDAQVPIQPARFCRRNRFFFPHRLAEILHEARWRYRPATWFFPLFAKLPQGPGPGKNLVPPGRVPQGERRHEDSGLGWWSGPVPGRMGVGPPRPGGCLAAGSAPQHGRRPSSPGFPDSSPSVPGTSGSSGPPGASRLGPAPSNPAGDGFLQGIPRPAQCRSRSGSRRARPNSLLSRQRGEGGARATGGRTGNGIRAGSV
jgi:hypothetical protein